jgi:hypothetical protein
VEAGGPGVISTHSHVLVVQVEVGEVIGSQLVVVLCCHQCGNAVPACAWKCSKRAIASMALNDRLSQTNGRLALLPGGIHLQRLAQCDCCQAHTILIAQSDPPCICPSAILTCQAQAGKSCAWLCRKTCFCLCIRSHKFPNNRYKASCRKCVSQNGLCALGKM